MTAKPGHLAALIEFLQLDAQQAADNEPGTLRFDVYPAADDPDAVYLYEAYASPEAFDIHMSSELVKRFISEIAPAYVESSVPLFQGVAPVATNVS
jgi:(4S)-4-hydroxy-5-phosphonooxypentane-2,3-dione isomerase